MIQAELNQTAKGRLWRYRGCRCCSRPVEGEDCPYCGLPRAAALDDARLLEEMRRVKEYRAERIRGLTDFCVETHRISWDASADAFTENGKDDVKIADGADCFETTVWSEEQFAQSPEEEIAPITLRMHFRDGQTVVPFTVPIQPVRCSDFWRIGVRLNGDFSLSVFLGLESHHAQAEPVMILRRDNRPPEQRHP